MNKFLVAIGVLLLVACFSKNEVTLPQSDLVLHISQEERENITCTIKYDSAQYQDIEKWFFSNQNGWEKKSATYLPNKVITGLKFKAITSGNLIIVEDFMVHDVDLKLVQLLSCI